MKTKKLNMLLCAFVTGLVGLTALPAKANITITPTIVVIEGRERYADIHVVNTSSERQTYEIGWKFMSMKEGVGSYDPSEKSLTDFDLTKNIIFTPRRVTLPPKGVQKVRLGVRLTGAPPPPGDYRAHIVLLNKAAPPVNEEVAPGETGSQVSVGMNVGFSIPVIYRVGDGAGGATIGEVSTQINPKTNKIEAIIPITRNEGPYGTIGSIRVNYNGTEVGQIRNANIFPEIKSRTFKIPLNVKSLSGGALEVVYSDYDIEKDHVFDRKSVNIGQ